MKRRRNRKYYMNRKRENRKLGKHSFYTKIGIHVAYKQDWKNSLGQY